MGSRFAIIAAMPLLLATPSFAQEQGSPDPVFNLPRTNQPPADSTRQGPELDVFRGAPVTPPPPVALPTITPPPPVVTTPPAPQSPTPAPAERSPVTAAPRSAPARTEPAPQVDSQPPAAAVPQSSPESPAAPQAAPTPTPAPAPVVEPPLSAPADTSSWPLIAGGIALLAAALAAWLFFRRRNKATEQPVEQDLFTEDSSAERPVPEPKPAPTPPILAPKPRPAAIPKPAPPAAPAATATDRPWLDLSLEIRSARLSLMGATIGYSLTLHNRGSRAAEDILIRSLIANADTRQQAMLQQFFAGSVGMPAHSAVSVAPGESHSLTGELRLLPDQIAPVQMGDRSLLIPLVAFDAQYRWADDANSNPTGTGRTGRAFIVGQEKSPPADRLAPFRMDQGPRQFRAPGSRATALELAN